MIPAASPVASRPRGRPPWAPPSRNDSRQYAHATHHPTAFPDGVSLRELHAGRAEVESLPLLHRRPGPAAAGGGGALQGRKLLPGSSACVRRVCHLSARRRNPLGGRGPRAASAGCQQEGEGAASGPLPGLYIYTHSVSHLSLSLSVRRAGARAFSPGGWPVGVRIGQGAPLRRRPAISRVQRLPEHAKPDRASIHPDIGNNEHNSDINAYNSVKTVEAVAILSFCTPSCTSRCAYVLAILWSVKQHCAGPGFVCEGACKLGADLIK